MLPKYAPDYGKVLTGVVLSPLCPERLDYGEGIYWSSAHQVQAAFIQAARNPRWCPYRTLFHHPADRPKIMGGSLSRAWQTAQNGARQLSRRDRYRKGWCGTQEASCRSGRH